MTGKQAVIRLTWCFSLCLATLVAAGTSAAEEAEDGWTGDVAVSVTAQSGTTDTFAGSLDAKGERAWDKNQAAVRFSGVYGTSRQRRSSRTSTETIQNAQALYGDWKRTIHQRFFWDSGAELSRDNTQDRELRAAFSTGPGYRLWVGDEGAGDHFDVDFGLGYRYEIYDGNTGAGVANNGDVDHFADAVLNFEYKNRLFDRINYTHTGSAKMPVNDTRSYVLLSEIVLGVPLSDSWSFRTGFLVEYVANPGSDEVNNTTTRTTIGLGYKF